MAYDFHYKGRIYFEETDAGGLIHCSNYFRYMEEAETEFLMSVFGEQGLSPREKLCSTPHVALSAEFISPTRFGQLLGCHLQATHKGSTSMSYAVPFKRD